MVSALPAAPTSSRTAFTTGRQAGKGAPLAHKSVARPRPAVRSVPQAIAAEAGSAMKVYNASGMSEAELAEVTARPRIDFTSILGTVGAAARRGPPDMWPARDVCVQSFL